MASRVLLLTLLVALTAATAAVAGPRKYNSIAELKTALAVDTPQKDNTLCLACTLLFGLLNQKSLESGQTPYNVIHQFCTDATNPLGHVICEIVQTVMDTLGLDKLDPKMSPEATCQAISFCPKPIQCTLFKTWPPQSHLPNTAMMFKSKPESEVQLPVVGDHFWADIINALQIVLSAPYAKANIKQLFSDHLPMQADDMDNDTHATNVVLRGGSWRGRDCNDTDATVYPGRVTNNHPSSVDHNCNGIYGNDIFGKSLEDEYCGSSDRLGTIVLGDSAAAHFALPSYLLNPSQFFNTSNWDDILHMALNEADWPMCSWSTGYETPDNCPQSFAGPVSSVYAFLRNRNRCNHRDYQNIAVNGARSGSMAPPDGIVSTLQRSPDDAPALVFYALIGNDVCSGHPDTDHMTTPDEFRTNVMATLTYLDTILAKGSHVLLTPLADGLLLRKILVGKTHPIGVPYQDIYDFLICNGVAPCYGWMTSNETMRNFTQDRANQLSAVLADISQHQTFQNFDTIVLPGNLLDQAVQQWISEGKDPAELIEPVDGFHPSSTANALTASYLLQWLQTNHPDIFGNVNPHNADIITWFGDQGGY